MRSTKAQRELTEVKAELRTTQERLAVVEREHADMAAELAPSSEQGKAYQSKLARMEDLLHEMGTELGRAIDVLMSTRQSLEIVCAAATYNTEAIDRAKAKERDAQGQILELLRRAGDLR